MDRNELTELHYITDIRNIPSIMKLGILSHKLASKIPHVSVAMEEIQEKRRKKVVPGGRPLHEYVNLYIHARNKMLYKRKEQHNSLCILRISPEVLNIPGSIVVDKNASSAYARFYPSPEGLIHLDGELVFADSWTHPEDKIAEWRHGSIRCAEVLVPDKIPISFINGVYVSGIEAKRKAEDLGILCQITIDPQLFFL